MATNVGLYFLVTFIEQFASNFNEEILYEEDKQKSK